MNMYVVIKYVRIRISCILATIKMTSAMTDPGDDCVRQLNIFQSLEAAMKELGVDGKACLLRTICELQESPVAEWTFVGELITHFLTSVIAPGRA